VSEPSQSQIQPRRKVKRKIRRPKVLGYITSFPWLYQWGLEHNLQVYEEDGKLNVWNTQFQALHTILLRANGAAKHHLVLDPTRPGSVIMAIIISNDVRPSAPEKVERRKQLLKAAMETTEDPTWLDASS